MSKKKRGRQTLKKKISEQEKRLKERRSRVTDLIISARKREMKKEMVGPLPAENIVYMLLNNGCKGFETYSDKEINSAFDKWNIKIKVEREIHKKKLDNPSGDIQEWKARAELKWCATWLKSAEKIYTEFFEDIFL